MKENTSSQIKKPHTREFAPVNGTGIVYFQWSLEY
jgi:hypothetical protein